MIQNIVISLQRTPTRLEVFKKSNQHVSYSVFPAVDGNDLRADQLAGVFEADSPAWTRGALGCYLSHVLLWQKSISENRPLTIIEDDALLSWKFQETSLELTSSLPSWDLVLWGWNMNSVLKCELFPGLTDSAMVFDNKKFLSNYKNWLNKAQECRLYRVSRAFGTPCYSISPRGAEKLLRHVKPIRPMNVWFPVLNRKVANTGIDIMMNAVYDQLHAYACLSPLAVTPNDVSASTVQTNKPVRLVRSTPH